MINNEYGFSSISEAISTDSLKSAILFLESGNPTIIQYIGTLSLLAYIDERNRIDIEQKLKNILQTKFMQNIFSELEKLPTVFKDLSNFNIDKIHRILKEDFSYKLLEELVGRGRIFPHKEESFYGITYLFIYLLELDLDNFEKWIIDTKRLDFQIIFYELVLSENPWIQFRITISNLDAAKIGILQAFYVLRKYNLSNFSHILCNEIDINDLFTTKLSERSKFIVYLKFIIHKYHGKKLLDLNFPNELGNFVDNLLSIKYDFTENDLFAESPIYYSPIYLNIIYNISDKIKQKKLSKYLFDKLLDYFLKNDTHIIETDYANILGHLSILLDSCKILEEKLVIEYEALSFPYSFCKLKKWQNKMKFALHLLISIAVYKSKKKESVQEYLEKFIDIKNDKQLFIEYDAPGIVEQIFDEIKRLTQTLNP